MHSLASRTSFLAVVQLFAYNGLIIGSYAGSLPTLQAKHQLLDWQMSILFIVSGIGAITAMQICGRLSDRIGARRVALATILPLLCAPAAIAFAPNYWLLLASGFCLGVGNGSIDITMNAIAVQVEKARPRPVMSFFHGMWAAGNFIGALLIVTTAWLTGWQPEITMRTVLLGCSALGVLVLCNAYRITPQTEPVTHVSETGDKTPLPRAAYLLGLMAIAFGLGEGTASDWSSIHVSKVTGINTATAALGVTVMSGCMVIIRVLGDLFVARWGRRAIVRFGGTSAVIGYLIVATCTPLPVVLTGWALVGLGMGVVAPQVYGVAGHTAGGRGLAVVVTFGYATFLAAPALLGALMSVIGIQHTMFIPAALLIGLVALAKILPRPEDDPAVIQK